MKKLTAVIILLAAALTTNAQFDTTIFEKEMPITAYNMNVTGQVVALGDQNSDGCDDILIWDCDRQMASIYLGGEPMSTEPYMEISIDLEVYPYCCGERPSIASLDINNDGNNDIIFHLRDSFNFDVILICYGGSLLDDETDIIFRHPKKNKDIKWAGDINVIKDFNGDGRSEFSFYEGDNTISGQHFSYYIYNIGAVFDTTEYKVISPAVEDSIDLQSWFESGDLNGDGYADLSFLYTFWENGEVDYKRTIIPGNPEWNLMAVDSFYYNTSSWDVRTSSIIEDMNGDGKDDILVRTNKGGPPRRNALFYGSIPVDTLEDAEINGEGQSIDQFMEVTGDFNGDGYGDLVASTNGFPYPNVKIWVGGKDIPPDPKQRWYGGEEGTGRMVEKVGDVDGDGVDDFCLGAVPYVSEANCRMSTVYIIKGDTSVATSVREEKELEKDFLLNEPYPNPFNPSTQITYSLKKQTKVKLTVYDTLGKEVTVLINKEQSAGSYEIEFNAEQYNLSSGVYFLEMITVDKGKEVFKESKKLVLMK